MAGDYSIDTGEKRRFGTVDYVLFSLMFCLSAAIGFYHAYRDRNKKKEEDFHFGGRKMHPIPVSLSLTATFISALTLLGTPSEVYTNNTMFYWIVVGMLIATIGAAHFFLPIFYRLHKTSCFEYLELRFGKVVRILASLLFLLQTLVYMGFVLYAPSLAFEAVTGVSLWGSMIGVAAVCTLYTTLGGMKTVLWTDSLQLTIMIGGLLLVLIQGSKATDGFVNAWNIANENGRIEFLDYSFDPRTRHSIWTLAIGGSFFWMYLYGVNQAQVQRACSLPSLWQMQLALWMNLPGLVIITTLVCMIGVVMFAFYSECHPVKYGLVTRNDQLLPLFVLDTIGDIPGLSGIFIACVFSGGLSTISSGLNAMSAILLEDYIKPCACIKLDGNRGIVLSKVLVIIIGCVQFVIAVMLSEFRGLILQFSYSLYSITAGPIFGLFVAGMFFPWTNQYGAFFGFILSLGFMVWLGVGSLIEKPPGYKPLPVSVEGCNWNATGMSTAAPPMTTISQLNSTATEAMFIMQEEPILYDFYRMSYQWYTGLGMVVNVVISLIVSVLTGYTKPSQVDSRLMIPFFDIVLPCLPERIRKPLRFGVVYDKEDEREPDDETIVLPGEKVDLGQDNPGKVVLTDEKDVGLDNHGAVEEDGDVMFATKL